MARTKKEDLFTAANLGNQGTVFKAAEKATSKKGQQTIPSEAEKLERANALRTQGRKGCKLTRINMAFTPENHLFIKVMARSAGMTLTQFINFVIEAYRKEHPEIMARVKELQGMIQETMPEDPEE